jgi:hypothetical protein
MSLAFYRKKMKIVKAVLYTGQNIDDVIAFVGDNEVKSEEEKHIKYDGDQYHLKTLEGYMPLPPGYFVIQGVEGEYYRLATDRMKKRHTKIGTNTYIKKPLIIKAFRYTGKNIGDVDKFTEGRVITIDDQPHIYYSDCPMSFDCDNYIIESDDERIKYYVHRHHVFDLAHQKVDKPLLWRMMSLACCLVFDAWNKAFISWEKFTQKISK